MLEFKSPEFSDVPFIRSVLTDSGRIGSEACVGNLYMWCNAYNCTISTNDDLLVCRVGDTFTVPVGNGDVLSKINELMNFCKESNMPLKFHAVTDEINENLLKVCQTEYNMTMIEDTDSFDYIYSVNDMAELPGKKYHSKRNHISYFENTFNWTYEEMTEKNAKECFEFSKYWFISNKDKQADGTDKEMNAIHRGLDNFSELGLVGGILRVQGDIVAYTFGEPINNSTFCTHVEKAAGGIRGAYPMINREFSRNTISNYVLVNREEDLGLEGLRKAKRSYYPTLLLKKYIVTLS